MDRTNPVNRRDFIAGAAAGSAALATGAGAIAQTTFPSRPIRWICYQAAGGSMDLTMRAYLPFLEKHGVRAQLDFVLGGAGNPARTQVFTAPPDGYVMSMDAAPAAALGEVVAGAAYKTTEFNPVFGWSVEGWQLCTRKDGPIKTLADMVKQAKERTLTVASIGRGSTSHLQLLVMQESLGIKFNIVHFTGSAQAYPQAIGGNVDVAIGGPGSGSRARDRLHIFGVFRDKGEPALADVPTLKASGFNVPEMNQTWYTMTSPKVPADRLARLTDAFVKGYNDPEFKAAQEKAGFAAIEPLMPDVLRKIEADALALANKYKDELKGS
jgi:tripartite-type tricarboxylate transporter receptor subunit TctC